MRNENPYILLGKIDVPAIESMDGVNSGNNFYFLLPENKTNKFVGEDNHDFKIEKPERHLHFKFTNGAWHYINECPACNGYHGFNSYCTKHDTCVDCNTNTKDLADGVFRWGIDTGSFRCSVCQSALEEMVKREALEAFDEENYSEWDYFREDEAKCPYCGSCGVFEYDGDDSPDPIDCDVCGNKFSIELDFEILYTTKRIKPKE